MAINFSQLASFIGQVRNQLGLPKFQDIIGSTPKLPDVTRDVYDAARREAEFAKGQYRERLAGYLNPRSTQAFQTLMNLASARTARGAATAAAEARKAALRRGYVGGADVSGRLAARERMRALAESGFESAARIREEEQAGANTALQALTSLANTAAQAGTAYQEQLLERYKAPATYLSAYGNILSGLDVGSILGAALKAQMAASRRSRVHFGVGGGGGGGSIPGIPDRLYEAQQARIRQGLSPMGGLPQSLILPKGISRPSQLFSMGRKSS